MGYALGVLTKDPGVVGYVILAILVALLAAFAFWAWLIKKRVGPPPPDRPGHETERVRFKFGDEPPGAD